MKKKYYICVDLEGLACVIGSYGRGLPADSPDYPFACKQGTKEACAAIDALFNSGADEVYIWDAHGTGKNLDYYQMDQRVKIMMGAGSRLRFPGMDETFSGVLYIGYHAYDAPHATLCHAYSSSTFTSMKINGKQVGELQIDAAIAGKYGVPALFVSGDDVCIAQAKESVPDAVFVETKKALAWNSCISKHPQQVCDEIYEGVKKAASRKGTVYTVPSPFTFEVSYKRIEYAQGATFINPDNTPFAWDGAYTRTGTLVDPEHIFRHI